MAYPRSSHPGTQKRHTFKDSSIVRTTSQAGCQHLAIFCQCCQVPSKTKIRYLKSVFSGGIVTGYRQPKCVRPITLYDHDPDAENRFRNCCQNRFLSCPALCSAPTEITTPCHGNGGYIRNSRISFVSLGKTRVWIFPLRRTCPTDVAFPFRKTDSR